jgi:hypothetical protein
VADRVSEGWRPVPSSFFAIKAAIAFFALAAMLAMLVGFAIYHDGIGSIVDWPELFNWLSAGCVVAGRQGERSRAALDGL